MRKKNGTKLGRLCSLYGVNGDLLCMDGCMHGVVGGSGRIRASVGVGGGYRTIAV